MGKYKLDSETKRFLKDISVGIPHATETFVDRTTITGEELLLCGYKNMTIEGLEKGEKPDKEAEYTLTVPGIRHINHYKRLCNAAKKEGPEGVFNYLAKYGITPETINQNLKIEEE